MSSSSNVPEPTYATAKPLTQKHLLQDRSPLTKLRTHLERQCAVLKRFLFRVREYFPSPPQGSLALKHFSLSQQYKPKYLVNG